MEFFDIQEKIALHQAKRRKEILILDSGSVELNLNEILVLKYS